MQTEISLIVPVYKEEHSIKPFLQRVEKVFSEINISYEIVFALDPSPDKTEEVILEEIKRNQNIKLLVFSRRFGQPVATMAGILNCKGESCIVIDVDLQDPPELIKDLYSRLLEGYEVVYAKRRSRKGETLIKRMVAYFGYVIINRLSDVKIPCNTGDFRIMTRRVIEELRQLNESHGFLRGLVAYVGFKQSYVEYDRDERLVGKGKYNRLTGSLKIGLNGIISFSSKPLQMMSIVGFGLTIFSFFLGVSFLVRKLIGIDITPGIPTIIIVVTFFSGIQLFSLGLMGEYIARIYDEVKRRPLYILDKRINF